VGKQIAKLKSNKYSQRVYDNDLIIKHFSLSFLFYSSTLSFFFCIDFSTSSNLLSFIFTFLLVSSIQKIGISIIFHISIKVEINGKRNKQMISWYLVHFISHEEKVIKKKSLHTTME